MENIRSADKAGQEIRKEVQRELEGRLDIDDEEVMTEEEITEEDNGDNTEE